MSEDSSKSERPWRFDPRGSRQQLGDDHLRDDHLRPPRLVPPRLAYVGPLPEPPDPTELKRLDRARLRLWAGLLGCHAIERYPDQDEWSTLRATYTRPADPERPGVPSAETAIVMPWNTWEKARVAGYTFTDVLMRTHPLVFQLTTKMGYDLGLAEIHLFGLFRPPSGEPSAHPPGRGVDITRVVIGPARKRSSPGEAGVVVFRNTDESFDGPLAREVFDWATRQARVSQVFAPHEMYWRDGTQPAAQTHLARGRRMSEPERPIEAGPYRGPNRMEVPLETDHWHHLHIGIAAEHDKLAAVAVADAASVDLTLTEI